MRILDVLCGCSILNWAFQQEWIIKSQRSKHAKHPVHFPPRGEKTGTSCSLEIVLVNGFWTSWPKYHRSRVTWVSLKSKVPFWDRWVSPLYNLYNIDFSCLVMVRSKHFWVIPGFHLQTTDRACAAPLDVSSPSANLSPATCAFQSFQGTHHFGQQASWIPAKNEDLRRVR